MKPHRILQISVTDEEGARFNGHELHRSLRTMGYQSNTLVWRKTSQDGDTLSWESVSKNRNKLKEDIGRLEANLCIQSMLYPFAFELPSLALFRQADLVHYHLIHTGYFSIAALPLLTRKKPSIWTLHDPWAMTGHCVHPFDCDRWKIGCGECPSLDSMFRLKRDTTHVLWKTKQFLYSASNIDIVLASKWMLKMAQESPLMKNFRLHHIPFGIDTNAFSPGDTAACKAKLGIPPENFVIALRAHNNAFKGLNYLQEAMDSLAPSKPITILAFNQKGHFDKLIGRHHIVEPGWLNNTEDFVTAIRAADIFLMPSAAESFGVMAIEFMACGKPVVVFEGTALPEVIFAPEGGIAIRPDTQQLVETIHRLIDSRELRVKLGNSGRNIVETHYKFESHVSRMLNLYEEAYQRRQAMLPESTHAIV